MTVFLGFLSALLPPAHPSPTDSVPMFTARRGGIVIFLLSTLPGFLALSSYTDPNMSHMT